MNHWFNSSEHQLLSTIDLQGVPLCQVLQRVVIFLGVLWAPIGCSRSHLPSYNEAEQLKGRAELFHALQARWGELDFIKNLTLKEGKNTFGPPGSDLAYPNLPGLLELNRHGNEVTIGAVPKGATVRGAGIAPNTPALIGTKVPLAAYPGPDNFRWIQAGSVALLVFGPSSESHDVRVSIFDQRSDALVHFHPLNWYPPQAAYWVPAKWVPLPKPRTLSMDKTHGGKAMVAAAPGYVEFRLDGKTMRLYPTVEQGQLWFDFRDRTSESTTYQAGRFLTIDTVRDRVLPEGTKFDPSKPTDIVLDFNGAQNPACAYNASTSCPIAPPENRLPVAILAGEKRFN